MTIGILRISMDFNDFNDFWFKALGIYGFRIGALGILGDSGCQHLGLGL